MADRPNKGHLSEIDLGADTATILTALAVSLEEERKWTFGIEGADFANIDDAVRQRINELKQYHEVFEGKKASLARFKTDMTYRTTTPTFVVPLKVDSRSSISENLLQVGNVTEKSLRVGKAIYIVGDVMVKAPLDVLLVQEKD